VTRRISSGGPWEDVVGYSRAVHAGPFVFVSGCTATVDGTVRHPDDAYEQALVAFDIARLALEQAGFGIADVVRTRMYVVSVDDCDAVGRAHATVFDQVRPAATMVVVSGLIDRAMRVEVEVDAYRELSGEAQRP
jgi:enamine deaminase RidA (YjgF/YER057c/UK114 family)